VEGTEHAFDGKRIFHVEKNSDDKPCADEKGLAGGGRRNCGDVSSGPVLVL